MVRLYSVSLLAVLMVASAQKKAEIYWHTVPCHGKVAIHYQVLPPAYNAQSFWRNSAGEYTDPVNNNHCKIIFNTNPEVWSDGWVKFCSIVVHEYGHLTGHPHSTDSNDVMYPQYQKPVDICK